MASRLILKDIKAPIHFLLRNPASSAPSRATAPLAYTIQNQLPPKQNTQSTAEFAKSGGYRFGVGELELAVNDRPSVSMDLKSTFNGGFRIEVRGGKRPSLNDDDDFLSDGDLDKFGDCSDVDGGGDDYDMDDFDDRDSE